MKITSISRSYRPDPEGHTAIDLATDSKGGMWEKIGDGDWCELKKPIQKLAEVTPDPFYWLTPKQKLEEANRIAQIADLWRLREGETSHVHEYFRTESKDFVLRWGFGIFTNALLLVGVHFLVREWKVSLEFAPALSGILSAWFWFLLLVIVLGTLRLKVFFSVNPQTMREYVAAALPSEEHLVGFARESPDDLDALAFALKQSADHQGELHA
jgi:hypothetical protein